MVLLLFDLYQGVPYISMNFLGAMRKSNLGQAVYRAREEWDIGKCSNHCTPSLQRTETSPRGVSPKLLGQYAQRKVLKVSWVTLLITYSLCFFKEVKDWFICMNSLLACLSVSHTHAQWPQRPKVGSLELEWRYGQFWASIWGGGNWNWVLCNYKCSGPLSHLSSPSFLLLETFFFLKKWSFLNIQ